MVAVDWFTQPEHVRKFTADEVRDLANTYIQQASTPRDALCKLLLAVSGLAEDVEVVCDAFYQDGYDSEHTHQRGLTQQQRHTAVRLIETMSHNMALFAAELPNVSVTRPNGFDPFYNRSQ